MGLCAILRHNLPLLADIRGRPTAQSSSFGYVMISFRELSTSIGRLPTHEIGIHTYRVHAIGSSHTATPRRSGHTYHTPNSLPSRAARMISRSATLRRSPMRSWSFLAGDTDNSGRDQPPYHALWHPFSSPAFSSIFPSDPVALFICEPMPSGWASATPKDVCTSSPLR